MDERNIRIDTCEMQETHGVLPYLIQGHRHEGTRSSNVARDEMSAARYYWTNIFSGRRGREEL